MVLHGKVANGVVVLDGVLPDGTMVQVTALPRAGDPLAVIAAMEAEPHLSPDDIAEWQHALASAKRPAAPIDPFGAD